LARFRIDDGECVVVFEGTDGQELLRTAALPSALLDESYVPVDFAEGGFCFTLHVPDGPMLAVSPIHATRESRDTAMRSVQREAPNAYVTHAVSGSGGAPPFGDTDSTDG
jgi:hypothetical protein